ncbi:hypothetical protein D3C75_674580 [compost metagenome]
MDQEKVEKYLIDFSGEDDTHPEVRRFIKDFLIKIEFGHFAEEDDEEDDDNEAWNNR